MGLRRSPDATGSTPPAYTPVAGSTATVHVTGADGSYTIESYATDNSGNDEKAHQTVVTLDDTPPVTTITQPTASAYNHSDLIKLDYSTSDGAGSGVKSSTTTLDGSTTTPNGGSLASGQTIDLLNDNITLTAHTFAVTASDNLGNTGSKSVVFTVVVTAQSIESDVSRFLASGKIKSSGLANSLLSKLQAAADARARGNCNTAANDYQLFIAQVTAQTGKGIDPAAAQTMINDAQYLIAHCP